MKEYKVPVEWSVYAVLDVEADSLEEAVEMVKNDTDKNGNEFALPDGDYIDGSFKLGCDDIEEIRECFNGGVKL